MSEKNIVISGKKIDYGNMNDEQLLKLYNQLFKRQALINQKIKENRKNK